MWRETALQAFPGVGFRKPARDPELAEAEQRLGREMPAELKHLLLGSNGMIGQSSVSTVWALDQIVEQNLLFWSDPAFAQLYMPFDALLFFGDNGGGDHFALVQKPQRPDIFVWEHETDSRRWVAGNLRDYLTRSLREGGDDWYQL
jgi:hypothetical protein